MTPRRKTPSRRPLPAWKTNLFRCLAVLLPILGLEAGARIYWVQFVEKPKSGNALYESILGEKVLGDEVPYRFFPNHEFVVATTPTKTNNLRLRGDYDVDPEQEYTGTRILCVGDSVTFGYCVSGNQAAYPAVLEKILRSQGIECQVLNAGMPRFRIEHLATFFHDRLRHYQPDLVIVLGGWNNANDHVLRPIKQRSWLAVVNKHWYLLRVIRHLNILPQFGEKQHAPAVIDAEGLTRYGHSLRRLVGLARETGAEPVLCTLPHFFHHLPDREARDKAGTFTPVGTLPQLAEAADAMNDQIREVSEVERLSLIELGSIDSHDLFADAIHPNDEGSAKTAELVASFLLERGLVKQ